MAENKQRPNHICTCSECQQQPRGETAKLHASINHVLATLNEKNRRRFVALLATQHGYGGVQYFARVTGLSRPTILHEQREITDLDADHTARIRALGGGGQFLEKKTLHCSMHWKN